MNEQNFSSTDAKFLCKYQVMSFFHHTYCLQNLKITLNWCGEQNSQLSSTKFGDKKLEWFFCMELFSELIYHVSKSNGNVFFGVIWCETHCITHVRVPQLAKTGFPLARTCFLCSNAVKWAVARYSNRSGTIVRVTMKFP